MIRHLIVIMLLLLSHASMVKGDTGMLASSVNATFESHNLKASTKELISSGEWTPDKRAFLVHIPNGLDSLLYVFIMQENRSYIAVDLSKLVNSPKNYKFGRDRSYYEKYEQSPNISIGWDNYIAGVSITTKAWKDGQRYTVKTKPVLIKLNGDIFLPMKTLKNV